MAQDIKYKYCRQCSVKFSYSRSDALFCSGACVAKFYRENDNPPLTHAEKPHVHTFYCEQCSNPFEVNDYAFRSGKRRPKFCSNKCKQAAYRGRVAQQAARRYGGAQQEQQSKDSRSGTSGTAGGNGSKSDNTWATKRFTVAMAYSMLELSVNSTMDEIKRKYRALCKEWHPDQNQHKDAAECTLWMQKINRAYDLIVKSRGL